MTPNEIDPVGPVGPMGSGGPRRRRKPSGGGQAITMILSWLGGGAAAIAVAFWILQYVKPAENPEQEANDRPVAKQDSENKVPSRRQPKRVIPKTRKKADPVVPKSVKPSIDLKNFQPPAMAGLTYRYYQGKQFGMSSFATTTPDRSGVIVDIGDLPTAEEANGLQLQGFWETKTEQACSFLLDSTNGARLWIDDLLVLDNTAQFERKPVQESRTLQPGMHSVRVDFVLSTAAGSYELAVGGGDDSKKMNLDRLLQPFGSENPSSLEVLEYELAKYDKPGVAVKALSTNVQQFIESSFVETVSATPVSDGETAETILPEGGKLVAGLAISPDSGRVGAVIPIYLDEFGLSLGKKLGKRSGQWKAVIAEPGFAVSAFQIKPREPANNVSLEFRQIDNKSLLPTGAYTQTLRGQPVSIAVSDECQPVVGLRVNQSDELSPLVIDAVRVHSGKDRVLAILTDGLAGLPGRKEAPAPNEVKKRMSKLMKESSDRLKGKAGRTLQMELKALAESTAREGRSDVDDESRFVKLLEARRLHLLAGEIRSAFAIMDELLAEYEYDYWKDLLAFFRDAVRRAGSDMRMQRLVVYELGPAIATAQEHFEFEVAGKLAVGGKVLATAVEDQELFDKLSNQLEEFERDAKATKLARVAAKTLISRPDDPKSNRVMGIFSLVVMDDWGKAMKYFARCENKDCEFIALHDASFDGTDAEIAIQLADCWKRVGKKNDAIEKLAADQAKKILIQAKEQARGQALKNIEDDLNRL